MDWKPALTGYPNRFMENLARPLATKAAAVLGRAPHGVPLTGAGRPVARPSEREVAALSFTLSCCKIHRVARRLPGGHGATGGCRPNEPSGYAEIHTEPCNRRAGSGRHPSVAVQSIEVGENGVGTSRSEQAGQLVPCAFSS